MKIKTQDLSGESLNYAATLADKGNAYLIMDHAGALHTCYRHEQHGSIEREEIGIKRRSPCMSNEEWEASGSITAKGVGYWFARGPAPLIAAIRCFVASRLGDEVEIPEELIR